MVVRLPIPASGITLGRLMYQGWIEIRGKDQRTEAKLTDAGLKAMRSQIQSHALAGQLGSERWMSSAQIPKPVCFSCSLTQRKSMAWRMKLK